MTTSTTPQQKANTLAEIMVAYGYLNKALVTSSKSGMKKQAETIRKIIDALEKEIFAKFYQDYPLGLEDPEATTEEVDPDDTESKPVLALCDDRPLWARPSWEEQENQENQSG
jgi:hypothetical protein